MAIIKSTDNEEVTPTDRLYGIYCNLYAAWHSYKKGTSFFYSVVLCIIFTFIRSLFVVIPYVAIVFTLCVPEIYIPSISISSKLILAR